MEVYKILTIIGIGLGLFGGFILQFLVPRKQ